MSDTPRTDAELEKTTKFSLGVTTTPHAVSDGFARQLERELNEAKNSIATLRELRDLDDKLIIERDQLRAEVDRLKVHPANQDVLDLLEQRDQWRECATQLLRTLDDIEAEDLFPDQAAAIIAYDKLKGIEQ